MGNHEVPPVTAVIPRRPTHLAPPAASAASPDPFRLARLAPWPLPPDSSACPYRRCAPGRPSRPSRPVPVQLDPDPPTRWPPTPARARSPRTAAGVAALRPSTSLRMGEDRSGPLPWLGDHDPPTCTPPTPSSCSPASYCPQALYPVDVRPCSRPSYCPPASPPSGPLPWLGDHDPPTCFAPPWVVLAVPRAPRVLVPPERARARHRGDDHRPVRPRCRSSADPSGARHLSGATGSSRCVRGGHHPPGALPRLRRHRPDVRDQPPGQLVDTWTHAYTWPHQPWASSAPVSPFGSQPACSGSAGASAPPSWLLRARPSSHPWSVARCGRLTGADPRDVRMRTSLSHCGPITGTESR